MSKITLKKGSEPIELTSELLLKAYNDAEEGIEDTNACAVTIDLGVVEIKGKQCLVSVRIDNDWD